MGGGGIGKARWMSWRESIGVSCARGARAFAQHPLLHRAYICVRTRAVVVLLCVKQKKE